MASLDILWVPDPILKTKCAPVMVIDDALRVFLDDMLDTMYAAPGIGLAGPRWAAPSASWCWMSATTNRRR